MLKFNYNNLAKSSILCFLMMVVHVHGQIPKKASPESIIQFLELIGMGPIVNKNVEVYKNTTLKKLNDTWALAAPSIVKLTPQRQQVHTQKYNKIRDRIISYYDWKNLKNISIPIYQNAFNQQQMNDLITFAKTPTGNLYWKKINEINSAHQAAGASQGAAFDVSINKDMEAFMEEAKKSK